MKNDATPAQTPDVSVILVSWNTRKLLLDCLASLSKAIGNLHVDIWVVDNGSRDNSVAAVRQQFPTAQLIENHGNPGFAAANNQAIVASAGRYALLLNSDTIAEPRSIERLVRFADAHPRAGIVGAQLLNPDHSFQASYASFPSLRSELLSVTGVGPRMFGYWYPSYGPRRSQVTRQVDWVQGACMLARKAAIRQAGLMDEQYFMYNEEIDWCRCMWRAGWEIWYLPEARIIHYGGQSTSQVRRAMIQALYRSKVRFFRKHYGALPAAALQGAFVAVLYSKWLIGRLAARGHAIGAGPPIGWRDLRTPMH
jgi:N-acetylglucosaminyl-diphospho-decaprenol L-rhamnosyltransferase